MIVGEDGNALAEDALGLVSARGQPPEVAVGRLGHVRAGGVGDPADRQDVAPTRLAAVQHELTEPAVVAQRHADAAAAALVARDVLDPDGVLLHAVGLPDLLRQVLGHRLADGVGKQHAGEVRLAGLVDELGARRRLARQAAHVADHRIDAGLDVDEADLGHVGIGVGVVLVPLHARGHGDQLAHVDAVVGAALQLGDVGGDRIVQALDLAVLDRRADQGRGHRLGHRERGPPLLGATAQAIALQHDAPVLDHQHAGGAEGGHVGGGVPGLAVHGELGVDRLSGDRQRMNLGAVGDHPDRRELLHIAIAVFLLGGRPGEDGRAGRGRRRISGQRGAEGHGRQGHRNGQCRPDRPVGHIGLPRLTRLRTRVAEKRYNRARPAARAAWRRAIGG